MRSKENHPCPLLDPSPPSSRPQTPLSASLLLVKSALSELVAWDAAAQVAQARWTIPGRPASPALARGSSRPGASPDGRYVACGNAEGETHVHDARTGQPADGASIAALRTAPEGWMRSKSAEGVGSYFGYHTSPVTGWTVSVGVPSATVWAPLWRLLLPLLVLAVVLIAVGMTFVILTGGIDLSVGSVISLAGVVTPLLLQAGWGLWTAIGAGVAVGALCGLVNGLLVTKAKMPPLIPTLGMLSIARGLALVVTRGRPITTFGEHGPAFLELG